MKKFLIFCFLAISLTASGDVVNLVLDSAVLLPIKDVSRDAVCDAFSNEENVFHGFTLECVKSNFGAGASIGINSFDVSTLVGYPSTFVFYDLSAFVSIHILGERPFIDPFLELGAGTFGYGLKNGTDHTFFDLLFADEQGDNLLGYCYTALGAAVNFIFFRGGIELYYEPFYFYLKNNSSSSSINTNTTIKAKIFFGLTL